MSSKSFKKKKEREKAVKKKLLSRRAAIRAEAKEGNEKAKEEREIRKVTNRLEGRTIRNKKDDKEVISQLQHNLQILEALQKEQELLEQSQKEAPQINQEEGGKLTASADVVFIPKEIDGEQNA